VSVASGNGGSGGNGGGGAIVNIGAEVVVVNTTFIDDHSVGGAGAPVS